MTVDTDITLDTIGALITTMSTTMYKATDSEIQGSVSHQILETCHALLALDYKILEVSNNGGELSTNYPHRLLIPENELPSPNPATMSNGNGRVGGGSGGAGSGARQTIYEHNIDAVRLREHLQNARLARCRARFPIPVILFRGRFICRSATLSGSPELYGRSTFESIMDRVESVLNTTRDEGDNIALEMEEDFTEDGSRGGRSDETYKNYIDEIRANDIRLLDYMNVGVIVDLMVENKKVKYGLNVSSSEKVDKEKRYAKFHIAALPYPGCEFFKQYRDNAHSVSNLYYDWSLSHNDVHVNAPDIRQHKSFSTSNNANPKYKPLNICWADYQKWDLKDLTKNYMRAIIQYMANSTSGLLVHCISGWDRTPLFVSLLRMCLWADGSIHQSLSAERMLYFTIAYDWFLFGHNLPDRLNKGEDIFFFCFNILKELIDRDFCTVTPKPRSRSGGDHGLTSDIHGPPLEELFFNGASNSSDVSNSSPPDANDCAGVTGNVTRKRRDRTISDRSEKSTGSEEDAFVDCENSNGFVNSESVPIPHGASASRQRNESTSSTGSWQIVTTTGSFRESFSPPSGIEQRSSIADQYSAVDEDAMTAILKHRNARLLSLRNVFYKSYWATVGRSKANGALGNMRP